VQFHTKVLKVDIREREELGAENGEEQKNIRRKKGTEGMTEGRSELLQNSRALEGRGNHIA